jgi:hypothetical protein
VPGVTQAEDGGVELAIAHLHNLPHPPFPLSSPRVPRQAAAPRCTRGRSAAASAHRPRRNAADQEGPREGRGERSERTWSAAEGAAFAALPAARNQLG